MARHHVCPDRDRLLVLGRCAPCVRRLLVGWATCDSLHVTVVVYAFKMSAATTRARHVVHRLDEGSHGVCSHSDSAAERWACVLRWVRADTCARIPRPKASSRPWTANAGRATDARRTSRLSWFSSVTSRAGTTRTSGTRTTLTIGLWTAVRRAISRRLQPNDHRSHKRVRYNHTLSLTERPIFGILMGLRRRTSHVSRFGPADRCVALRDLAQSLLTWGTSQPLCMHMQLTAAREMCG